MMNRLSISLALLAAVAVPVSAADFAQVQPLLVKNGCQGCHAQAAKVTGPSYHDIAARYINKPDSRTYLAGKIREGSSHTWGAASMPPNPTVDDLDLKLIVEWIAGGAPVPAAAPAAAPAVPVLDCWLGLSATGNGERRVGDLDGVVAVAPGEQRIRFHFTPRRKGYLYVVAALENGTWAQVTANPAKQKLQTNAIDVGRDVMVPGASDTYIPYVGPVTFTIVYSPTQLASPAFFSGPSGRQLSDDEVADWERFRASATVGRLEGASERDALTTLSGPDSASEPKALAFTITLERR